MGVSEAVVQLKHIRDFQITDLRKTDELASANFLVCVGCLNATEVLGGVKTGLLGSRSGDASTRLRSGLAALGGVYSKHEQDIVDLRNSMVHAYVGKVRNHANVDIASRKDPYASLITLGIQIVNGTFVVNVSRWIEDLNSVWSSVLDEITADPERGRRIARALEELPTLR
jgi:hypothetical protein